MRNHGKWLEKQNIHMVLFSMLYTGRGTPDKRNEIEALELVLVCALFLSRGDPESLDS